MELYQSQKWLFFTKSFSLRPSLLPGLPSRHTPVPCQFPPGRSHRRARGDLPKSRGQSINHRSPFIKKFKPGALKEITNLEVDGVIRVVVSILTHPPSRSELIEQKYKQQLTPAPTEISLSLPPHQLNHLSI